MDKYTLELTIDELNMIVNGLGQLPYVQVEKLLQDIKTQYAKQVNPVPEVKTAKQPKTKKSKTSNK